MLKKLFIAVLFGAFAVASISAQKNVDNFVGTWKLTKTEGLPKTSTVQKVTLDISQTADAIRIERTSEGVNNNQKYSFNNIESFDVKNGTSVSLVAGQFGGTLKNQLRVLAANRLRFDSVLDRDLTTVSAREIWTLSSDGKTLTIETFSRYSSKNAPENSGGGVSTKMTFSKE